MCASGPPRSCRSEGGAMPPVQDVKKWDVQHSSVERVIRRRDAIGLATLAALGLISSDAGRDLVDAAKKDKKRKKGKKDKKDKDTQGASSSGREVVHVAQKYK